MAVEGKKNNKNIYIYTYIFSEWNKIRKVEEEFFSECVYTVTVVDVVCADPYKKLMMIEIKCFLKMLGSPS